ncbi:MAG: ABC transporter substrate-binding protein [Desulfobacteraceae bacterium]|nr:ABC transporter substrate-binding protein [Desulfobacteraceae bacterium]
MKFKAPFIIILSTILSLFLLAGCGQKQESGQEQGQRSAAKAHTYKIGLSLAITGSTSDAGNPYSKGVEDYINYANEMKFLGDDKIKCMIRDDQYKNDVTKRNFEDFLSAGIIFYLNYSTGSTLALKRDFEEERIPVIPASFHAGNLIDSNYIFLPIVSYSSQAIGLSEYIVNNHKGVNPKTAMFIHPSAFGRGPVEDVKKAVAAGLTMDIIEVVEHGRDLDNTAMLKRLISKKVQYVICNTVQSPVATLLNDAQRLGISADEFGQEDKITFFGVHYTGGNDLIALAGTSAENFFWTTSYRLTNEESAGASAQLEIAQKYGRDSKTANSHNYTNGIMAAQIAVETIRRAKAKGLEINRSNLYNELTAMNGFNAYYPLTTVGPVTFSSQDHAGVDTQIIYQVQNGVFRSICNPFESTYTGKLK